MPPNNKFLFEISLSVLNHLGRNLYRNFITVLGEAISNSWDANADNVWIFIDRENNSLIIKDDGDGMTEEDFQGKFLKVGYSKRKDNVMKSQKGRPYIGAKGIGKLALLSCAEEISIISKTEKTAYTGGTINNSGLDEAIQDDLTTNEYVLGVADLSQFAPHTEGHIKGTIIRFNTIKEGIKNTVPYLRKLIALNFRFSLIDEKFNIYVDGDPVTLNDLSSLSNETEFLWDINNLEDPYISTHLTELKENEVLVLDKINVKGFIASVSKPRFLKIPGSEEKAGIDLFVNGRLREKDILRHLPDFATRYVASYLYGQVHFDELDNDVLDKVFTSSREGVVANNDKYLELLDILKEEILNHISDRWDEWRLKHKKTGDPENTRMTEKERSAKLLAEETFKEFIPPEGAIERNKIDKWSDELIDDARFNIQSYVDCFASENLIRKYIEDRGIEFLQVSDHNRGNIEGVIKFCLQRETESKANGNINIEIRSNCSNLNYLDMAQLTRIVETQRNSANNITNDGKQYKPIRDALMHTAVLTSEAKRRLTSVYDNIKGRLNTLLTGS